MKKIAYLLLLSLTFCISCEPDTEENELLEITALDVPEAGGIILEATYTGTENIENVTSGFLISLDAIPSDHNSRNVPGTNRGNVTSGEADSDLVYNREYYVRAYIRFSAEKVLYSDTESFVSLGSKTPEIMDINRSLLLDTVTIKGRYFTDRTQFMQLRFGSITGLIVAANDSIIQAIVPAALETYDPVVSVEVYGKKATYSDFSLLSPSIESISENSAALGDTLSIYGENFDFGNSRNKIIIDNREAQILHSTRDSIQFVLPERLSGSTVDLNLLTQLQEARLEKAVTVKKPAIAALPSGPRAYEVIEISGTNFSIFREDNRVYFDDHQAEVLEASRTGLKVRIPIGPYEDRNPEIRIELMDYAVPYEGEFSLSDVWLLKSRLESGHVFRGSKHFIHKNRAYLFEQQDENNRWKVQVMDPTTESWTHSYVAYPKPEIKLKDFSIFYNEDSGRVFFYFALEEGNFYEFFPDTKSFVPRKDYPDVERGVPATFSIDNRLYIGLGRYMDWTSYDRDPLSHFWSYNINTDNWEQTASFPQYGERSDLSVFVIDGNAYLGNGASNTGQADFWKYSPATDSWTRLADFKGARTYTSYFDYGGKAYVHYGSGLTGNPGETAFEYDPVSDVWKVLEPVNDLYYTYFIYPQGSLALRFENAVYLGMTMYPHIEFFKADLDRL